MNSQIKCIKAWMLSDPPDITDQFYKRYRPNLETIIHCYDLLNEQVFDNQLIRPKIKALNKRRVWGVCYGLRNRLVKIEISDRFYSQQWMIAIMAHEMAHQYQWQFGSLANRARMNHGPSFYKFKKKMKSLNVPLKRRYNEMIWFTKQKLDKC
jgi:SprT-like family